MKPIHYLAALSLGLTPVIAAAENTASFNWDIAAVSEYLFRSVSQTDEKPTLQGTLNWTSPVGISSGVDVGPGDPQAEVDYYVGYAADIGSAVNLDVQLARYTYPGASELAYNELVTTTTLYDSWKIGVLYSNDIFGSDTDGWYYSLDKEWALPQELTFSAHAGRSVFSSNTAVGSLDYSDWNLGISRSFGMANVTLAYYGTDRNGRRSYGENANSRVFLSVSIGK